MSIQAQLKQPSYELEGFSFYADRASPNHYPEHRHDELEICLILNEADAHIAWCSAEGDSKYRQLSANKLCIIPSHHSHTLAWKQTADYILIFLHPSIFAKNTLPWDRGYSNQFEGQYVISDLFIYSLALTLNSAFQNLEFIDHLYMDVLVNALVLHLTKQYLNNPVISVSKTNQNRRWLRQTLDYIHDSLGQNLRLSTLANIAYMSESNFCHLFKEQMKISPHQYILRQRVQKARLLLLETRLPIVEIAYRCGFNSQSHLTTSFRQHVGMTPKVFRNSH